MSNFSILCLLLVCAGTQQSNSSLAPARRANKRHRESIDNCNTARPAIEAQENSQGPALKRLPTARNERHWFTEHYHGERPCEFNSTVKVRYEAMPSSVVGTAKAKRILRVERNNCISKHERSPRGRGKTRQQSTADACTNLTT